MITLGKRKSKPLPLEDTNEQDNSTEIVRRSTRDPIGSILEKVYIYIL